MMEIFWTMLATRRAQAIAEDRCFSKGRLRDEFSMKPAPRAEPVKWYKNTYGGRFINRNLNPEKIKKHPKMDGYSTPPEHRVISITNLIDGIDWSMVSMAAFRSISLKMDATAPLRLSAAPPHPGQGSCIITSSARR